MHPLNKLARKVHYFGWYQKVLGRMKRTIQPLYVWAFVLLLTSCTNLYAPTPFRAMPREVTYLDSSNPNHIGLHNADPEFYIFKSKIDLSEKPDIIP